MKGHTDQAKKMIVEGRIQVICNDLVWEEMAMAQFQIGEEEEDEQGE